MAERASTVPPEEFRNWTERALLEHIAIRQEEQTMTLADLQAAVASLEQAAQTEHQELAAVVQTAQDLQAQVSSLQSQLAGGGSVSTADLDAVTANVASILSGAQSAVESAKTAAPADPGAVQGGGTGPLPPAGGGTTPAAPTGGGTAPTDPNAPGGVTPSTAPAPAAAEERTLYTLDGDPGSVDATVWPAAPFVTSEQPARQLYYFAGDTAAGHRNGDGVAGVWHAYDGSPVATDAAGAPVEEAQSDPAQQQTDPAQPTQAEGQPGVPLESGGGTGTPA